MARSKAESSIKAATEDWTYHTYNRCTVWACIETWSEPESMKCRWESKGFTSPVYKIDLRVRGEYLGYTHSCTEGISTENRENMQQGWEGVFGQARRTPEESLRWRRLQ